MGKRDGMKWRRVRAIQDPGGQTGTYKNKLKTELICPHLQSRYFDEVGNLQEKLTLSISILKMHLAQEVKCRGQIRQKLTR